MKAPGAVLLAPSPQKKYDTMYYLKGMLQRIRYEHGERKADKLWS